MPTTGDYNSVSVDDALVVPFYRRSDDPGVTEFIDDNSGSDCPAAAEFVDRKSDSPAFTGASFIVDILGSATRQRVR